MHIKYPILINTNPLIPVLSSYLYGMDMFIPTATPTLQYHANGFCMDEERLHFFQIWFDITILLVIYNVRSDVPFSTLNH